MVYGQCDGLCIQKYIKKKEEVKYSMNWTYYIEARMRKLYMDEGYYVIYIKCWYIRTHKIGFVYELPYIINSMCNLKSSQNQFSPRKLFPDKGRVTLNFVMLCGSTYDVYLDFQVFFLYG